MDPYAHLLNPLENFNLIQLPDSTTGELDTWESPSFCTPTTLEDHQRVEPHVSSWTDFQDGAKYTFNPSSSSLYEQSRAFSEMWQSRSYSSDSNTNSYSPSTSSSLISSGTCSPWEICPGLVPASPDSPFSKLLETQLRALGTSPGQALSNLTLGSPIQLMSGLDPDIAEALVMTTPTVSNVPSIEGNALGLHLYNVPEGINEPNSLPSAMTGHNLLDNTVGSSFISSGSQSSSPVGVDDDAHSVPRQASPESLSSSLSLDNRLERSKSVQSESDGCGDDSDDDYDYEDSDEDSQCGKSKRRRISSCDDDNEFCVGKIQYTRRVRKTAPKNDGRSKSISKKDDRNLSNSKTKSKRRHYCPREGCRTSFTRITDMERHLASVHRNNDTNTNRCAFCNKAFSRDDAVLRHENDSCPMRPRKTVSERWV